MVRKGFKGNKFHISINFSDYTPASEAVRQLYEEKYNTYYKPPEDYSDDELIDLIEESLTAFGLFRMRSNLFLL